MTGQSSKNENANAEILGVVILIGIFVISAGLISATTLSAPAPTKMPAATIEITGASGGITISHLGGDPLPLGDLKVRGTRTDGGPIPTDIRSWLGLSPGEPNLNNGFSIVKNEGWSALVLIWKGNDGESVLASWDPSGIYGPLGPASVGSPDAPGVPDGPRTQPPVPTPTTNWNVTLHGVQANFTPFDGTVITDVGGIVPFVDTSSGPITHWFWNFGDGSTITTTAPFAQFDHPYRYEGIYSVTLTVSNAETGAHDTTVHTIQVSPISGQVLPVDFTIEPRTSGNRELSVTCLASVTSSFNATIWQWDVTDGLNGTTTRFGPDYGSLPDAPSKSQVFTFLNPDGTTNNIGMIALTVWSPYLKDPVIVTKTVTVGPPIQVSFSPNVTVGISPLPVKFVDTSIGVVDSWSWDFGDGTTSSEQNPAHVFTVGPNEVHTFTVTLTITGYDQTAPGDHIVVQTATATITVHAPIVADFTSDVSEGTAPLTIHFRDLSTGNPTKWTWSFGDGATSSDKDPVHTYTSDGIYKVSLLAEKFNPDSADIMVKPIYIRVGADVAADFTATPTRGVAPLSVQFTDASSSAAPLISWSWDFGDGTTSTERNPQHTYSSPGPYSVTLTAANAYRYHSITKTNYITVVPAIVTAFSANETVGESPMSVQFSDQSTQNPTIWSWNFGDGTTSDLQNPVHTYESAGIYSITLTASNADSTNTLTRTNYITALGVITASFTGNPTEGQAPLAVQFLDTSTGGPTAWTWDFGDNTTSDVQNPRHVYEAAGNYSVTLTASNPLSTSDPVTRTEYIRVSAPVAPTAAFSGTPLSGTAPLTVQFTDESINFPSSWAWDFNNDGTVDSTAQNPTYTYPGAGTYTVKLIVMNGAGSDDEVKVSYITVNAQPLPPVAPVAAFRANTTSGMAPLIVQFTDESTNSPSSWAWDFNNDDIVDSTDPNPICSYSFAGIYPVKLTVTNGAGSDDEVKVGYITVIAPPVKPVAYFTGTPLNGIKPLTVKFTDGSTNSPTYWRWDFNNDGTVDSTAQNPSYSYSHRGVYTVVLTVGNAAGEATLTRTAYITVTNN